jgi:hypothetical protein
LLGTCERQSREGPVAPSGICWGLWHGGDERAPTREVRVGSKGEILASSRCFLLRPRKQTSDVRAGMSVLCQEATLQHWLDMKEAANCGGVILKPAKFWTVAENLSAHEFSRFPLASHAASLPAGVCVRPPIISSPFLQDLASCILQKFGFAARTTNKLGAPRSFTGPREG